MDTQSQMTRPYGHDHAEDPIRIHHPEEEEHHEKGASKVLKKVKEKAKKIKNSLTKHGNGHDHDVEEEDDDYDEKDPEVHGAPVYESSAVRGGVTGKPESLSHAGETNVSAQEEIVPPGTKVFPVMSSESTKPIELVPLQDTAYGHEALSDPVKTTDISEERRDAPRTHPLRGSELSDREESREAHHEPLNTPVSLLSATEDVTRTFAPGGEDEYLGGQRKVNVKTPTRLDEDPAAPGGGSDYLSGVSNYQSKVTDPSHEGGEAGVPGIAESLGRMKVTDESPDQKSGLGFERDLPPGSHDQFSPELSRPKERDETQEPKPKTYTEQLGSATSAITNKAIAAKNAVASKLGYSGESAGESPVGDDFEKMRDETREPKPKTYTETATSAITNKAIAAKNAVASKLGYSGESAGESPVVDKTPRSATGYGQKVAGTVAEKLSPVYEKVKETGSTVMTKLPLSGGGKGAETQQGEDKTVSTRDYLSEKLRPGEEDKALSEMISEKLHFGGGGGEKKPTTTKEVDVTVEKIPSDQILEETKHGEALAKEGNGGGAGMVGKIKGAVTSWLGGTTGEVKPKSPDSVEESSQSLGSTVGTKGFSDSGGSGLGVAGGGSGAVQAQRGLGN